MKMTYTSNAGSVVMSGDGKEKFALCEIDGMDLMNKERNLVRFYNTHGYKASNAFYGQRVITVSGDVKNTDEDEIRRAIDVFSETGTLKIERDSEKREIVVDDICFKLVQNNGMYKKFCLQLTCDSPFFTECKDIFAGAYARENLITQETVLPAMFSKRTGGGNVVNTGNVRSEPKFIIECIDDTDEEGNIVVENQTIGCKIQINYTAKKGEIITVDIKERTITSSIAGDITYALDPKSFLCDMYLEKGNNYINAVADYGNRNCNVYLVFRNNYTGMVI